MALGSLGNVTGTFVVARSGSDFSLTVTNLSLQVGAGSVTVAFLGAGSLAMTSMETTGSLTGAISLVGVPAVDLSGNLALTLVSGGTFTFTGTGKLVVASLLDLAGTLTITRTSTNVTIGLSGTGASGSLVIGAGGALSGTVSAPLSLPVSVPGVTLGGSAAITFGSGALTVTVTNPVLVTPAGSITGSTLTITKNGDVLDLSATGMTLFLGDTASNIGVQLSTATVSARILSDGSLVLRVSGALSVVGASGLTFGGTTVAEYNPTASDVALGSDTVTALTTRVVGDFTLRIDGGVNLSGHLAVQKQGTGSSTVINLDATGVQGTVGPADGLHMVISGGALHVSKDSTGLHLSMAGDVDFAGTGAVPLPDDFDFGGSIQVANNGTTTTVTGTGMVLSVGPVSARGTVTVAFDSTAKTLTVTLADGSVDVAGLASATGVGGTIVFHTDNSAGPSVALHANTVTVHLGPATLTGSLDVDSTTGIQFGKTMAATLAVAGQSFTGAFTAAKDSVTGAVKITASNVGLSFGTVATISNGSIALTVSSAGVAGSLAATVDVSLGLLAINAIAVTVVLDTTGPAPTVKLTLTVPSGSSISIKNASDDVLGTITAGTFTVQRLGSTTVAAVSGLAATLQGSVSLTGATGALLVNPPDTATPPTATTGVAGYLSGTVGGATATVRWNTTGKAVDQSVEVGGTALHVVFGADEGSVFSVAVSGSLDLGPVSIEGTITFTHNTTTGRDVFAGTGLTVFFGDGPLTLANGDRNPMARGVLLSDATIGLVRTGTDPSYKYAVDATGTVALIGIEDVTIAGTVRIRYNNTGGAVTETIPLGATDVPIEFAADNAGEVKATGLTFNVLGQSLQGDVTVTHPSAGGLSISVSNLSAALSAGGTQFLSLTGGSGTLQVSAAGIKATSLTATINLTVPGVTLDTGTFTLSLDTTGTTPVFAFSATSASLTIGGTKVGGTFTLAREALGDGSVRTTFTLTSATVTVATASAAKLVELTGSGLLTFGSGGLAGSFEANIGTNVLGLSGKLTVDVDTAAGRIALKGTGITLGIIGPDLTADISMSRTTNDTGAVQLTVTLANASLSFPGLSLSNGAGSLVYDGTNYTGSLAGDVALDVPGVSISGSLAVSIDSATSTSSFTGTGLVINVLGQHVSGDLTVTTASTNTTITVANAGFDFGDGLLTVDDATATIVLTAGTLSSLAISGTPALHVPGLSLTATGVSVTASPTALTVTVTGGTLDAAGLALHANLTFTTGTDASGGRTMSISINNTDGATTDLLSIANVIRVQDGTGTVVTTSTGTTGQLTLAMTSVTFPGLSLTATGARISFGGATTVVSVTGGQLTVGGNTLAGSFTFARSGTSTTIGFTGVSVTLAGQSTPLIDAAEGAFVIAPQGHAGVAGFVSGTLKAASGGVGIGGTALIRVNSTGFDVNESVEVDGRTLEITIGAATTWQVSVSDMTVQIGDFVVIEGSISIQPGVVAGTGLRIFIGRGPAFLGTGGINPLATGVLVTDATIGVFTDSAGKHALTATGTVQLVGVDGVTLAGTVAIRYNDTGAAVDKTIAIAGSTDAPVVVKFAGNETSFSLTGARIGLLGQQLTADLAVEKAANGDLLIGIANGSIDLGGSVGLNNAGGVVLVTSTGLAGRVSGTVAVTAPGVTFGAGLTVAFNSTGLAVDRSVTVAGTPTALVLDAGRFVRLDGTGIDVNVLGQTLKADVSVERATQSDGTVVTVIGLDKVGFSFGTTTGGYGVTMVNGSGALVVTSTGVAGRLSGTVALSLPAGVSASGALALAINTASAAVDRTVTVGGTEIALSLPGGPYLRFEATGMTLTVLGQSLSGNFAFEKVTSSAGTALVRIGATHVTLSIANVLKVTGGSALVLVTPTGLAGRITGSLTLAVPQVSLSGDLAVELNTTAGLVTQTFTVAGVPTTLSVPAGGATGYVQVRGTGLQLSVLGQELTGDLTLTRSADAAGRPVLTIDAQNLALVLGAGSAKATFTQNGTAQLVVGPTGVVADIGMDVALSVPGVTVTGTLRLNLDTAAGYVKVTGDDVFLGVLDQSLTTDLTFEQVTVGTTKVVRIGVADARLAVGPVSVSNGRGLFVLAGGGVAGQLDADVSVSVTGFPLSLTGSFGLALNNTGTAVRTTLPVGSGTATLDLPAGPYLRISATNVVATVAGQQLSGNVTVEKSGTTTHLVATDVRMQLGDGNRALVRLSHGTADLVLGGTVAAGVKGSVSGHVELVNVPSVGLSGTFTAQFDSTATSTPKLVVTGTDVVLTVAGQTLSAKTVSFSRSTSEVAVTIDKGELAFTDGSGKSLLHITGVTGSLHLLSGTGTGSGVYGDISGTVAVDVPGVGFSGNFKLQLNTTGCTRSLTTGACVSGSPGTNDLTSGELRLRATSVQLEIAGQQMGATSFTVVKTGSGLTQSVLIAVDNLTLNLGNGAVTVADSNNWDGVFLITAAGMSGRGQRQPHRRLPPRQHRAHRHRRAEGQHRAHRRGLHLRRLQHAGEEGGAAGRPVPQGRGVRRLAHRRLGGLRRQRLGGAQHPARLPDQHRPERHGDELRRPRRRRPRRREGPPGRRRHRVDVPGAPRQGREEQHRPRHRHVHGAHGSSVPHRWRRRGGAGRPGQRRLAGRGRGGRLVGHGAPQQAPGEQRLHRSSDDLLAGLRRGGQRADRGHRGQCRDHRRRGRRRVRRHRRRWLRCKRHPHREHHPHQRNSERRHDVHADRPEHDRAHGRQHHRGHRRGPRGLRQRLQARPVHRVERRGQGVPELGDRDAVRRGVRPRHARQQHGRRGRRRQR